MNILLICQWQDDIFPYNRWNHFVQGYPWNEGKKNSLVPQGFPASLLLQLEKHCPEWFPSSQFPAAGWGRGGGGYIDQAWILSLLGGTRLEICTTENSPPRGESETFPFVVHSFLTCITPGPHQNWGVLMTVRYWMLRMELLKGRRTCSPDRAKELKLKIIQKQYPSLILYNCPLMPLAVPLAVLANSCPYW